ncbi:hypothetical protein JOC61_001176 [Marinitoga litoralis]|nr:hypothetical protein [Marinitoga litoralis]
MSASIMNFSYLFVSGIFEIAPILTVNLISKPS